MLIFAFGQSCTKEPRLLTYTLVATIFWVLDSTLLKCDFWTLKLGPGRRVPKSHCVLVLLLLVVVISSLRVQKSLRLS